MRKRNLLLDFTSLLDVIMIMLFIVMSSLGQSTLEKQSEIEKQEAELHAENALINEKAEKILEKNVILESEKELLQLENDALLAENSLLSSENDYLRALNGDNVENKEGLLKSLLEDSVRIILDCSSEDNSSSSIEKVNISLFYGTGTGDKALSSNIIAIQHDRTLTREERQKRNNEMRTTLAKGIKNLLDETDKDIAIITIRLKKGDQLISQSDVDIIEGAIRDVSSEQIRCITDRMYY